MFEITYTEVGLLIWALIATIKWIAYKEDAKQSMKILHAFVENPKAREAMLSSYASFKKEVVNN